MTGLLIKPGHKDDPDLDNICVTCMTRCPVQTGSHVLLGDGNINLLKYIAAFLDFLQTSVYRVIHNSGHKNDQVIGISSCALIYFSTYEFLRTYICRVIIHTKPKDLILEYPKYNCRVEEQLWSGTLSKIWPSDQTHYPQCTMALPDDGIYLLNIL